MRPSVPHYVVLAEIERFDFDAEWLFVRAEQQFVERQLSSYPRRWTLARFGRWVVRAPRLDNWRKYAHALDHYGRQLADLERQMSGGLIPIRIVVANDSRAVDRRIKIRIEVENGKFRAARKLPERPVPADGHKRQSWSWVFQMGNFWRSKTKVTSHRAEAVFSRLGGRDAADLLNRPVFVEANNQTRLLFEVVSQQLPQPQHGEVEYISQEKAPQRH